jgi:hypothetical protein
MIPTVVGWSVDALPMGIHMTHPLGPKVATISYRERARPLLRVGAIVRDILARTPRWVTEQIGSPERLVTVDGEHAALVTVLGKQDGLEAQRDLGFVFGDDFFSSVGGLCFVPELRAELTGLVRDLTRADTHYLGVRRRRFEYDPPEGWNPVATTGFAVDWLAPEFPRDRTTLTVYAACPQKVAKEISFQTFDSFLEESGQPVKSRRTVETVELQGLSGQIVESVSERLVRRIALLRDATYVYPIGISTASPLPHDHPHWDVLAKLVRSAKPIPEASGEKPVSGLITHWVD